MNKRPARIANGTRLAAAVAALTAFGGRVPAAAARPPSTERTADPATGVISAAAEVSLIHATNDADGGIDPAIGKLPNLGSYKSYRLLQRVNVSLRKPGPPTLTTLPNQRTLQISLKDVKSGHFVIDTSINQPGGTAFLPLLEVRASVNVPVYIGGQAYQGGMLIIVIKILPS